MKRVTTTAIALCLLIGAAAAEDEKAPDSPFKNDNDKASYAIGMNIGKSIAEDELKLNLDMLFQGVRDALTGEAKLTDAEVREVMVAFQKELQARAVEREKLLAEKNKKEGAAFLAANKDKQGVKTLGSGLQYKVLKSGDGPTPKATDVVRTLYKGTLLDGTEFDSALDREAPATFPVNRVIAGWTEALQKMKVGDKWVLYVPSELAYGEDGAGQGRIGPNAVLIFEIELLGIEK